MAQEVCKASLERAASIPDPSPGSLLLPRTAAPGTTSCSTGTERAACPLGSGRRSASRCPPISEPGDHPNGANSLTSRLPNGRLPHQPDLQHIGGCGLHYSELAHIPVDIRQQGRSDSRLRGHRTRSDDILPHAGSQPTDLRKRWSISSFAQVRSPSSRSPGEPSRTCTGSRKEPIEKR